MSITRLRPLHPNIRHRRKGYRQRCQFHYQHMYGNFALYSGLQGHLLKCQNVSYSKYRLFSSEVWGFHINKQTKETAQTGSNICT